MAAVPQRILLFGATGVIGKDILQALVSSKSEFAKIGIFTSLSTAENKKHEIDALKAKDVEVVVGDVNSEADIARAYEGTSSLCCTSYICMLNDDRFRHSSFGFRSECNSNTDFFDRTR